MAQPDIADRAEQTAERLAVVRERIAQRGADPDAVQILAVTKGRGPEALQAATAAGLSDLGENYAQEMLGKVRWHPGVRWHFIGRLQSNKVRRLAPHVTLWQTVDRPRLAREIARHSPGARILVQVTARSEPNRGGCEPAAARRLVVEAADLGLCPRGLMLMALPGPADELRAQFGMLRRLADDLDLPVRSMGTSSDYPLAVAEGANMLRLGTTLFGPPLPEGLPGAAPAPRLE